MKRVLVIVGHPDPDPRRFCRALAEAYAQGAEAAGHDVRRIDLAEIDVPLLKSREEFENGSVPTSLADASAAILWAEHIVFVFPLWLGTMPALLKAFLEQVMRPGIAFDYPTGNEKLVKTRLNGRSARVIVTMGMPAFVYRLWYLGHGIAGMRRGILNFVGIKPVREKLYGMVEGVSASKREQWIAEMHKLGASAS
ncbi:putative NADPH-quinone reductase (modulator of drug activity B) (plasmid) [Sinorhizobium sojae CCBAU 05684]|uniref:Putative NADPH-quinone reductase (Modulator of drug activity B) n=1 Tax=Sinorhizobium sojae CCBAU 05684 TaxID=716928 RepID=A0A249PGX3_9HYPH|nr:putative NADPH-quinone reductase (modulator of drug activity B) [Sinorhizobium sojae CCBAU 05684]